MLGIVLNLKFLLSNPLWLLVTAFQVWMFVDAIRQREWIWAIFIVVGWGMSAFFYYLFVYRTSRASSLGFELPGAHQRRRIRDLQAQIHHLDKAHHYSQLGDIYFHQGKLEKAESCYRSALERDPQDIDTRAHFGQCLLRQKKPAEARPLLESVIAENPEHDYGFSQMALAEALTLLGDTDQAMQRWKNVTEKHSYPRAKVQLAETYLAKNQPELARAELKDVLDDDPHAPAFQRKRDRQWVSRAQKLIRKI